MTDRRYAGFRRPSRHGSPVLASLQTQPPRRINYTMAELRQVFPRCAPLDSSDAVRSDAELGGNRRRDMTKGKQFADLSNLVLSQFRHAVAFAAILTALGHLIGHIVGGSPKKQVIRADAISHIAGMADSHVVRDRAVVQLIGKAMCSDRVPVMVGGKRAVAPSVCSTYPQPTVTRCFNLFPKPISRLPSLRVGAAQSTTEQGWASFCIGWRDKELTTAELAGSTHGTLGRHQSSPFGVTPSAVLTSARAMSSSLHYSIGMR